MTNESQDKIDALVTTLIDLHAYVMAQTQIQFVTAGIISPEQAAHNLRSSADAVESAIFNSQSIAERVANALRMHADGVDLVLKQIVEGLPLPRSS